MVMVVEGAAADCGYVEIVSEEEDAVHAAAVAAAPIGVLQ